METDIIPAGIDIDLAGKRSHLIEAYRHEKVDAAATYKALEALYWSTQPTADDETRYYLRETSYAFPVEATELSQDDTDRIEQEVYGLGQDGAARIVQGFLEQYYPF